MKRVLRILRMMQSLAAGFTGVPFQRKTGIKGAGSGISDCPFRGAA